MSQTNIDVLPSEPMDTAQAAGRSGKHAISTINKCMGSVVEFMKKICDNL